MVTEKFEVKDFTLGIPTFSRPYQLRKTLKGILQYDIKVIVLINSQNINSEYYSVQKEFTNVNFVIENRSLGVARAWNKLIMLSPTPWIILSSDDLSYQEDWFDKLKHSINNNESKTYHYSLSWPMTFSSFCIHKKLISEIGWFDENFLTAYYEDEDWYLRIREHFLSESETNLSYEEIIPFLKCVSRKPHENTSYNSVPNYLYFRLKWKLNEGGAKLRTRENIRVKRRINEKAKTIHQLARNSYLNDNYRTQVYIVEPRNWLLSIVLLISNTKLVKFIIGHIK